jgi:hypothetical protein
MDQFRVEAESPIDALYQMAVNAAGLNFVRCAARWASVCEYQGIDDWYVVEREALNRLVVDACSLVLPYALDADEDSDTAEAASKLAMMRVDAGTALTTGIATLQVVVQKQTGSTLVASVVAGTVAAHVQMLAACFDIALCNPRIAREVGQDLGAVTARVMRDTMAAAEQWNEKDWFGVEDMSNCVRRDHHGNPVDNDEDAAAVDELINGTTEPADDAGEE